MSFKADLRLLTPARENWLSRFYDAAVSYSSTFGTSMTFSTIEMVVISSIFF